MTGRIIGSKQITVVTILLLVKRLLVIALLSGMTTAAAAQPAGNTALPALTEAKLMTSFEVEEFRLVPLGNGLKHPWGMAFRDNGDILVTERDRGTLRVIREGALLDVEIAGVPAVESSSLRAGLMDVELHPDDDRVVYLTYSKGIVVDGESELTVALARGLLVENALTDVEEIFTAKGLDRGVAASWLQFTPDGKLLMSVGGSYVFTSTGEYAQDTQVHYGKLLRLNADGSAADDNPFVGNADYLPEIYSMGHRNQLGLAYHPETGDLWATENGPQGGDEVNIIRPGQNYGWPLVSYSRQYRGAWVAETQASEEFQAPEIIWWPSIAPSGMAFYTGEHFPRWQGNLFVGSMITGRIPGTGHLERIVFNRQGEEIRRERLLTEFRQRVRDVRQGPDGFLYVLIDEEDGVLLRIEPTQ